MPDIIKAVVAIESVARPEPRTLLEARALIQRDPALQEVFTRSREESWPVDRLALELEDPLQGASAMEAQEAVQVARYLADEYQQVGDSVLLISRETGKAISRVTEEDFWQPPVVAREDGTRVTPKRRLKPDVEAALILWHHERDREQQLIESFAPSLHQTELLRSEGDARLLPLTYEGRSRLVEQLRPRLPELLAKASGSVGHFLAHFELREDAPPKGTSFEPVAHMTATARAILRIEDMKASNLRFDRLNWLCNQFSNAWGREIATTLADQARKHFTPTPKPYTALTKGDMAGVAMWILSPDTHQALSREVFPKREVVLPIDHVPSTGLVGGVGVIVINRASYDCAGRELSGRWEVAAKLEYTLWVNWAEVRSFDLQDVGVSGISVVS